MPARFDTIPSRPISHALEKTSAHSASIAALKRMVFAQSIWHRSSCGRWRGSSPSKALRHALAGRGEGPLSVALDLIEER
jgi:hypothetical protein